MIFKISSLHTASGGAALVRSLARGLRRETRRGQRGGEPSRLRDKPRPAPAAPPAESTGGFDGQQAYQYVADQVAIGPRSAGTEGDTRAQQYIIGKLQSFGCPVDQEDFHTSTPIGSVAMKNIVAKVPGASPDIVLFTTHYDTKRLPNFVGADDGGSSTGVMLELARLVCARKNALTVWVAFFDGEEAFNPDCGRIPTIPMAAGNSPRAWRFRVTLAM